MSTPNVTYNKPTVPTKYLAQPVPKATSNVSDASLNVGAGIHYFEEYEDSSSSIDSYISSFSVHGFSADDRNFNPDNVSRLQEIHCEVDINVEINTIHRK